MILSQELRCLNELEPDDGDGDSDTSNFNFINDV